MAFRTFALGLMADYGTDGVVGARIGRLARADTLAVTATQIIWTIIIRSAPWFFDRDAATFDVRVSKEAGQTLARHGSERQRVDDQTLGVYSARFDDRTRIDTITVETSVFAGTFTIGCTSALD